ncbi:MAG TPA: 3-phosphoserine/phosphohydroxythreonine transaminase [Pyrinomonadaceae bacterium]|nr:3-phosphoserine/phosphohydroxythreonine transaminase [Pyrinomonadaceae bacterium]
MSERVYSFSAGPAVMPEPVLQRAKDEMMSVNGIGMSVMEVSHRSKYFEAILESAHQGIRDLMHIPDNYRVLFTQGGASMQFSAVPMNLLPKDGFAEYITTGYWGKKGFVEAKKFGCVREIYSSEPDGYRTFPSQEELKIDPHAAYVYYTSNETIDGVEFKYELDGGGVPVVCDASSNILSKPFDIEKYALMYAGAQKNIGPSGIAVVIIRDDMLDRVNEKLPAVIDYRQIAKENSMPNTPNTWAIYLISLVCEWLKGQGGPEGMQAKNEEKAKILYKAIDSSDGYYTGTAERHARSIMNVTFKLPSEDLDTMFCEQAEAIGLNGLAGHRSVGGVRASIYNAFPREGVVKLAEFMQDFSARHG